MLYLRFTLDRLNSMEGTRNGRGRGVRQPTTEGGTRGTTSEPTPELRVDPNVQVAAAIQRMTDLLAHVVEQQGENCLDPTSP